MNENYRYIGCFFDLLELLQALRQLPGKRLARVIAYPHVTFSYQPQQVDERLFGTPVQVTVTGYGCDGENEALQVRLCCREPALQQLIDAVGQPHITVSVSEGGQPVNSNRLQYTAVAPFALHGCFGGYVAGEGPCCSAPTGRREAD